MQALQLQGVENALNGLTVRLCNEIGVYFQSSYEDMQSPESSRLTSLHSCSGVVSPRHRTRTQKAAPVTVLGGGEEVEA